jgi:hypothetical protein
MTDEDPQKFPRRVKHYHEGLVKWLMHKALRSTPSTTPPKKVHTHSKGMNKSGEVRCKKMTK